MPEAVADVVDIDAADMLEKAARALRLGFVDLAVFINRQAVRKLGLLSAAGDPEAFGRGLLEVMAPRARGLVLRAFIGHRSRLVSSGVAEAAAGAEAAREVAGLMNIPCIAPEDYAAVIAARRNAFVEWLPQQALQALDSICSRTGETCEDAVTRALAALLVSINSRKSEQK